MTVTHDKILALLVIKDERLIAYEDLTKSLEARIVELEADLAGVRSAAVDITAKLRDQVDELKTALARRDKE